MSKINLGATSSQPATLLKIDGSAYVNFIDGVDTSMNKVLKFKMWLDASLIYYPTQVAVPLMFRSNAAYGDDDKFAFYSQPSPPNWLNIAVGGVWSAANGMAFEIPNSMCNTILNCEFRKKEKTFIWFKVNDVSVPSISPAAISGAGNRVGYNSINMSIWDVEIYDYDSSAFTGPGTLIHSWKGYPAGNTTAAWENQIGTADGSIILYNDATPTTRTISGVNYSVAMFNKLLFKSGTSISGGLDGSIVNSGGTRNIIGGPNGVGSFNRDTSLHIVCPSTLSSINLNNEINFKLYLDVSNFTNYSAIFYNGRTTDANSTKFTIYLKDNYLIADGGSGMDQIRGIDISALSLQILDVKVKSSQSGLGRDINYIKINDITQTSVDKSATTIGQFDFFKIGLFGNPTVPQFQYPLFNATVWDIDVAGIHHWKGYPDGNTNAGWLDVITTRVNTNKLLFNKRSSSYVYELLNFNNTYVGFTSPAYVNISEKKKINFWLYLDSSNFAAFSKEAIFNFQNQSNSVDGLKIYGENSDLHLHTGNLAGSKKYSMINFAQQRLYCEVVKIDSSIVSLSINGSSQTSTGQSSVDSNIAAYCGLGYGGSYFSIGTIWDIEVIDNSTGTMLHKWAGYPAGNTNAAWTDLVGANNGLIGGPGPYITRSI